MTQDEAKKLALDGYRIFPLQSNKKIPLSGSHGFKDASTDISIIDKIWRNKCYNAGIATGNGLLVIDLDVRPGKNGLSELSEWEFRNRRLPETYTVKTPSGGRHLYFYFNGSISKDDKKYWKEKGIDLQDSGHYVVAAGSQVDGKLYEVLKDVNIANADETVIQFIKNKDLNGKVYDSIQTGSRDNTLTAAAWKYANEGMTEDEALEALRQLNNKCDDPLDDSVVMGKIKSAFRKLSQAKKYNVINLSDVKSEKVKWLWYPYIPIGKITLIQGDPGSSKTMFCLYLSSIVSKGGIFPGDDLQCEHTPEVVIYQTAEDGIADTIKPRLEPMKPNFNNIFVIDESERGLTLEDARIEEVMKDLKPKLLIIDPLQAYLGAGVDMHRANEVRPVLAKIGRLAEKYECAVVFIMHMSKMSSTKALYRALGSIDIPAVARSMITIAKNPNNKEQRVLAHEKSSLAKNGQSILYHIDFKAGAIVFDGFSDLSADEILKPQGGKKEKCSLVLEEAKAVIEKKLSNRGYAKAQDIIDEADNEGISRGTLNKAKKELGIQSKRSGSGKGSISWWCYDGCENDIPKNNFIK